MWWFSSKTIEEISETEFKNLVSSSASKVKQFLLDNPHVVFKGIPVLLAIYFFYPVLLVGWYYLPWVWVTFQVYQSIPPGTIPVTTGILKQYLTYQQSGRLTWIS